MRLSSKEPLVINLDGKNVTRSKNIIDIYDGSFIENLESTVKYFTERYKCLAIFGADEVSFIFEQPMDLINDLNSDKSTFSTEVISVFSQYFYDYFNSFDKHQKVFWHGKCFSIHKEKIISYIKYKSKLTQLLVTTFFLKHKGVINAGTIPLADKKTMCEKYEDYNKISDIKDGILYYCGNKINLEEYYKGNIKIINDKKVNEDSFLDLLKF